MTQPQESSVPSVNTQLHPLSDTWTLWGHLPHDTDWSRKSYKNILADSGCCPGCHQRA